MFALRERLSSALARRLQSVLCVHIYHPAPASEVEKIKAVYFPGIILF
jgi:hypothetical protein